jgi:hypothetical protein
MCPWESRTLSQENFLNLPHRIAAWFRRRRVEAATPRAASESDTGRDSHVASGRVYGGPELPADDPAATGDAEATTGPGRGELFVGRVAGQDLGYAAETGAERRRAGGHDDRAGDEPEEPGEYENPHGGES